MQVNRDQLQCKGCGKPIVLPRQSPLGIFQNLENPSTYSWTIDLLHHLCGRVFSYSEQDVDDPVVTKVQTSHVDDLLRVEYEDAQGNSQTRKILYATCPAGSPVETERERMQRYLSGVTVWSVDLFPY